MKQVFSYLLTSLFITSLLNADGFVEEVYNIDTTVQVVNEQQPESDFSLKDPSHIAEKGIFPDEPADSATLATDPYMQMQPANPNTTPSQSMPNAGKEFFPDEQSPSTDKGIFPDEKSPSADKGIFPDEPSTQNPLNPTTPNYSPKTKSSTNTP